MDQKGYSTRHHRVHVAVYRMAVRKGQLIKRGPNVYCYWP